MTYKVEIAQSALDRLAEMAPKVSARLLVWIHNTLSSDPESGVELQGKLVGKYAIVTANKSHRVFYTLDRTKATVLVVQVVKH